MDLNKSREYFDPKKVTDRIHIIGCGSIGSNVAELLVRYGIEDIVIHDFDKVEPHNIANQLFTEEDIHKNKTDALAEYLYKINPALKKKLRKEGKYTGSNLNGFVFMCVDSVETRNMIVDANINNPIVKGVFDFRTTLLEGQCYYANWGSKLDKESLKKSLDFTHEEAQANTPVSACGFELSVAPVVKMCSIMGIANFTNLINTGEAKHLILCQPYKYFLEAL